MKKRRHGSLLEGVFFLVWSISALGFSIHAINKGSFTWVSRRGTHASTLVQPDTHPYFYWGWLMFWTGVGIWIGFLGFKSLLACRSEKQIGEQDVDGNPH
jgi:hypothetical protein